MCFTRTCSGFEYECGSLRDSAGWFMGVSELRDEEAGLLQAVITAIASTRKVNFTVSGYDF
jgi:hypothetical protein